MTAILPTVGRKIYFYPNGDPAVQQFDAQPIDATVVYVWPKVHPAEPSTMNLYLIDHAGATHFKTRVILVQDGDPIPSAGVYAQWMPYQVGQAAKKEAESANAASSAAGAATTAVTSDSSASSESPSTAAPSLTTNPLTAPIPSPSTDQTPASAVASTADSTAASSSEPVPVAAPVQTSPTTEPAPSASPASPAVVVFPPVEVQSPPVVVGSGTSIPPTASASSTPTAVAPSAAPTTDVPQSVTLDRITSKIKSALYVFGKDAFPNNPAFSTLTFCGMVLQNGFIIIGKSACVDPKKFNEEDGKIYAYKDAFEQIWQLEGYLLKQEIYQAAQPSTAQ
jgi:hypothetical protein